MANGTTKLNRFVLFLLLFTLFASEKAFSQNAELHQDTAWVDVAIGFFNKKAVDVYLKIPSKQAYDFEGKAANPQQQATVDSVVDSIKQNIASIIILDQALGCKHFVNDIDPFSSETEKYSEFKKGEQKNIKTNYLVLKADITIRCTQDLRRKKINVNLSKNFKDIKKIKVNLDGVKKRNFVINSSNGNFDI